ncbi:MAG: thioredoxin domain-containing protein [Salinirussus sp.]
MSDPTARNRLDESESPYLRQHAQNPVHWQPWDDAALTAARERDDPIFLSVGYAACHWCHVMAEESFEDEDVAAVLNDGFVPVKVDREERPDLDRVYQTICQRVTGRGGWPLSVFLTPDGRPFYVGTYFPKEARRNAPGFLQLIQDIRESWQDPSSREEIESRADEWADAVRGELESTPEAPDNGENFSEDILISAAETAVRGADREYGGWGRGQKFPHTGRIHLLLRAYAATDRDPFIDVAVETLDAMADRGLYDHVGGGFHRYATDREWTVPHFEKMLYDNAELPRVYLAAHQITGDGRYAQVARNTFRFIERELRHPEGGFYSTLDARSDGTEGAFYVWTPTEVHRAITDDTNAALFCDRFGITERGNFEGDTVLTIDQSIESLAEEHALEPDAVRERLDHAQQQIFDARSERNRPARDEKILASWNGLAISAFAEGAIVLDEEYADTAAEALGFVREHCWDGHRLRRRWADDVVRIDGYLEDYAFLGRGALDLYQARGDVDALEFALELGDAIVERFWEAETETLYFTAAEGEDLVARPQEVTDQSTPSSTGVAVDLLHQLSHFRPDDRFDTVVEAALSTQQPRITSNPLQHVSLTLAADRWIQGDLEVTLTADEQPAEWTETLQERYLPRRLLAPRPVDLQPWLDELGLESPPAIWADRGPLDGEPAVYACQSFACSPPKHSLTEALDWAGAELDTGAIDSEEIPF